MSENRLDEELMGLLEARLASSHGGGMVTGFICLAEFMDSDGETSLLINLPESQPVVRSLGLAQYACEVFRTDTAREYLASLSEGEDG